jgi:hypothetical protein
VVPSPIFISFPTSGGHLTIDAGLPRSESRFFEVLPIAFYLAYAGASVKMDWPNPSQKYSPDMVLREGQFSVCEVEVKSFSSARSLGDQINKARKQADHIIIYGTGLATMEATEIARILTGKAKVMTFHRIGIWTGQILTWRTRSELEDYPALLQLIMRLQKRL